MAWQHWLSGNGQRGRGIYSRVQAAYDCNHDIYEYYNDVRSIDDETDPKLRQVSLTREDILGMFSKEPVPRVRCSFIYRLGLLLVTLAIIALALGFAAVLGGLGWSVWISADAMLRHPSLVSMGMLAVSATALIFVIRPIFHRRFLSDMQEVTLKKGSEPALETLINEIAQRVGAPKPRVVAFNCSVNASASLKRGLFGRRDLKLTIGLPLIYGLTSQQLAGIIAHELGHFSQGAGMRLTIGIRCVNYWLERMAYGRDQIDHWMAQKAEDNPLLAIARLVIVYSRAMLGFFSHLAHVVSCFALRQMEYDADSYEARVAGSDCFASTERRILRLNLASQLTLRKLEEAWSGRRLAMDLPEFIAQEDQRYASEIDEFARNLGDEDGTRWFSTHPSGQDRIRAAEAIRAKGIFHLDAPATQLMRGLSRVSELATQLFYELEIGLDVSPDMFCNNEIIADEVTQRQTDNRAAHAYFCGVHGPLVPLTLSRSDLHQFYQQCQQNMPNFRLLADKVRQAAGPWRDLCPRLERTHERMHALAVVKHQAKVGMLVDAASLGIKGMAIVNEHTAQDLWSQAKARQRRTLKGMRPFQQATHERLGFGLAYLFVHQRAHDAQWTALRDETLGLLEMLEQLPSLIERVSELGERFYPLSHFSELALAEEQTPPPLGNHLKREASAIIALTDNFLKRYKTLKYPFEHSAGTLTLGGFLTIDLDKPEDPVAQALLWPPLIVTRCNDLYQRVMTRLASIALHVEQVAAAVSEEDRAASVPSQDETSPSEAGVMQAA